MLFNRILEVEKTISGAWQIRFLIDMEEGNQSFYIKLIADEQPSEETIISEIENFIQRQLNAPTGDNI